MTRQTLQGKHGIIGYLEEKQDETVLRDKSNSVVGRYSKIMDRTYGKHGEIVNTRGNILMSLLTGD